MTSKRERRPSPQARQIPLGKLDPGVGLDDHVGDPADDGLRPGATLGNKSILTPRSRFHRALRIRKCGCLWNNGETSLQLSLAFRVSNQIMERENLQIRGHLTASRSFGDKSIHRAAVNNTQ